MTRDDERLARASQPPIVPGVPEIPGIGAAMALTPDIGVHLRGLADALLVNDFPGATLRRAEREMIAAATSAGNDCFFCMDSHAAHARALMGREGATELEPVLDVIKVGSSEGLSDKMAALLHIARTVRRAPLELAQADVDAAIRAGASDGDVQLAVLIAAAFSMYNRLVDGFRARTPAELQAYAGRAEQIAELGYSAPPPAAPEPRPPG